jgi:hypothetical protein
MLQKLIQCDRIVLWGFCLRLTWNTCICVLTVWISTVCDMCGFSIGYMFFLRWKCHLQRKNVLGIFFFWFVSFGQWCLATKWSDATLMLLAHMMLSSACAEKWPDISFRDPKSGGNNNEGWYWCLELLEQQVGYHQKGLCKGYVLEWNIAQNLQKRRWPFKTKANLTTNVCW